MLLLCHKHSKSSALLPLGGSGCPWLLRVTEPGSCCWVLGLLNTAVTAERSGIINQESECRTAPARQLQSKQVLCAGVCLLGLRGKYHCLFN